MYRVDDVILFEVCCDRHVVVSCVHVFTEIYFFIAQPSSVTRSLSLSCWFLFRVVLDWTIPNPAGTITGRI